LRGYELSKLAAFTAQGCAFAHLLQGDLDAARHIQLADLEGAPGIAMTQTSRAAVGVRLAYYAGDDAGADRFATAEAMDRAFASGETQNLGLLAGCVAAHYDETDRREEAAALRARALQSLRSFDYSFWLLDQLAAGANPAERRAARAIIERAANDLAARASLVLFDARLARASRKPGAKEIAADAAAAFEAIGWPWERAQALEIAGRYAEALDVCRRHGFERHAVKLADRRRRARHRTGRRALTKRELEVARLAAAGESNRAIAQRLFIGERTVETHIASIFDRFDLASRRQLSALVDELGEPPGEVTEKPSP
jgi:DNA-binding CsgD family transcriptional regulator